MTSRRSESRAGGGAQGVHVQPCRTKFPIPTPFFRKQLLNRMDTVELLDKPGPGSCVICEVADISGGVEKM